MSRVEIQAASNANDKDCLRVVLDSVAQQSVETMASRLKAVGGHIKFYPSTLVSFIVSDFCQTYFEKDIDVLVAKFFDSKAFLEAELQKAKGGEDTTDLLKRAMATINKVSAKKRKNGSPRAGFTGKNRKSASDEP